MTLTDLRYFIALAREKHFGRAAEKCHVSQPTLSVAIKKLEDELGVILFERGQGDISLTPAGDPLLQQAERVLAEAARLKELAETAGDPLAGPLRLGAIHTIGPYLLPRLVPLLRERAPRMPLYIEEGFTARLLDALKAGELDVAILALPITEAGLVAQPVYDEEFRVLVPAAHPWARKKAIAATQLLDEPLLMLGRGNCFRDQVLDLCARAGSGGPQVMEGSSLETIRYMVGSGMGITVMPATAVEGMHGKGSLACARPFEAPSPTRRVGLVWRSSFPRHQVVDLLRQILIDIKLPGCKVVGRGR